MIERKLERHDLPQMAAHFKIYFTVALLEPLLEDVVYSNIYFEDFADFLRQDFNSVYSFADFYFPRAPVFSGFLQNKFERYLTAHTNYIMHMNLSSLFQDPINYGFTPKLE